METNIEELDNILIELVSAIDIKRGRLEEEYKKAPQYKNNGNYRLKDEEHLNKLLTERNTLVSVINYIRTKDKNSFKDVDYRTGNEDI